MEKKETFVFDQNKKEYLIKLPGKDFPCWLLLIPFFLSVVFIIVISVIYFF